jgi:hypothetical protein
MVKNLFKLLDKKHPEKLARCLEILVALLKGKSTANSQHVYNYLKNYKGINYAMTNVDASEIPVKYAEAMAPEMETIRPAFTE